tara:strand:- start:112 stop:852 length:741 start_codon:yes stop_codon:yes gene_type:complete
MQGIEGGPHQVHPTQQQQPYVVQQYISTAPQKRPNYLMIGAICITIILILMASVTFLVIYSVDLVDSIDSNNIDVTEGQQAPNFIGDAHHTSGWEPFELYDHLNKDQYILIQFIDTDCGHCWNGAAEISNDYAEYGTDGNVTFITVASGMLATDHSRAEIVAFQEKGDFVGCYNDEQNCADRPGNAHNWLYVDDNDMQIFDVYNPPGVPFHLLLDSNGTVVWNSGQHGAFGDPLNEVNDALNYYVG